VPVADVVPHSIHLATGSFITRREDALFLGPGGAGKSHLAQAIGHAAIQQGRGPDGSRFTSWLPPLAAPRYTAHSREWLPLDRPTPNHRGSSPAVETPIRGSDRSAAAVLSAKAPSASASNNRAASLVELPGLTAWVHSVSVGPGNAGGDVHYVSVCPSCIVSRIALADVSGHGQAVAVFGEKLRELMQRSTLFFKLSAPVWLLGRRGDCK
jgi:IstB-like ATP binding protein